jgi:hypothetical protein
MPVYSYEVATYRSIMTFQPTSWGAVSISTKPDFHGIVYPFTFFFFDNTAGQKFSAFASGSSIFSYSVYVEMYGGRELFSGMLDVLASPGPKHISVDYEKDLPISGGVNVNAFWAQLTTDPALATLTANASLQRLPEKLRPLLSRPSGYGQDLLKT